MDFFDNLQSQEPQSSPDESEEELLDLNTVMQAFGISSWNNLGPVESLHPAILSLLVEINGERYVLRERPEGIIGEDINYRYDFQSYLHQSELPIPIFRLTPQGEPMVVVGEDCFELQQQPSGEQFNSSDSRNLDWIASAGSMLGRLHQASRQYLGHKHRWPSEANLGAVVQGHLNLAHSRAETCENLALGTGLSNWVDQWEAVLPSAMTAIGAARSLPEFHIHGDYHALNLRFHALDVSAVMGFEASRWEKRIFEVAYALFYFSALSWQPEQPLTRPLVKRGFSPERARAFLHAYGQIYPPVPGEAEHLADALMIISPIATINGPLEDLFYSEPGLDETLIEDVLERLSWASSLPAWLGRVRHSLAEMWSSV